MRVGELVAQVGQRECAPLRDGAGVPHRVGQVAELRGHFGGRTDVALGIAAQRPPGAVQRRLEPDAGERVVERFQPGHGVADSSSGYHAQAARAGRI